MLVDGHEQEHDDEDELPEPEVDEPDDEDELPEPEVVEPDVEDELPESVVVEPDVADFEDPDDEVWGGGSAAAGRAVPHPLENITTSNRRMTNLVITTPLARTTALICLFLP